MEKLSARRRRRRRRRRHLEIQVDIQARKLYLKVFLWFWGGGERDLEMETGFYTEFRCGRREHSGLAWGAIFEKVTKYPPAPACQGPPGCEAIVSITFPFNIFNIPSPTV